MKREPPPELPVRPANRSLVPIAYDLIAAGDSLTAESRAAELIDAYRHATPQNQRLFFGELRDGFGVDHDAIERAIERYRIDRGPDAVGELSVAVEPTLLTLVRRINMTAGGLRSLLDMRADLLDYISTDPELGSIDQHFAHVLQSWFNVGFLQLRRLDWDSPASILKKLIDYEAVHAMTSWTDLRRRLEDDRRCFAFFHPALPTDPLTFVEVALTDHLVGSIQEILNSKVDPDLTSADLDTAIFYSITSCQPGLRGIFLGPTLIQQTMRLLAAELPTIKTFATLSPVPSLSAWLQRVRDQRGLAWLEDNDYKLLHGIDDPSWIDFPHLVASLEPIIMRACARYLTEPGDDGRIRDPVARFHLRNGARLERINWLGDISPKGRQESAGVMVNYLYQSEDFSAEPPADASIVATTPQVRNLAHPPGTDLESTAEGTNER